MYCPNCQAEYVAGVKMCPECGVPLVDEQSEDAAENETDMDRPGTDMEPVFSTNNFSDVALIKSALDAEGIEYIFQGETRPMIEPARLLVREDQADRALEIIADLNLDRENLQQ
jgi:hypothetical protein